VSASARQRVSSHGVRIVAAWGVLCAVAIPLIVLVLGPHLPPGHMSAEASAQTDANTVMTALLVPIMLLVVVYVVYALFAFHEDGEGIVDGPPIRGHGPTQLTWVLATSVIVLSLAVWGSYTLVGASAAGAGGGQGPSPSDLPAGHQHALPIQVIGQQWAWTFRFPTYGGFETRHLELPVNKLVAFHVTSLDVTHSFWAYELGVKADAVPGVDNVAFVTAEHLGEFTIRCAELCGLWHGHMATHGRVAGATAFASWVKQQQAANAVNLPDLVPYNRSYFPEPKHRAG
jgi:cytochrome c oxidase subunit II